ncbi:EthD family reductase [Pontibacter sp. JAM-7]|uniref:EthD family reductase n=1 Tax=Pontibacter sp. JAM-7 TaxID=3366581 RepID=UPI003AF6B064
MIKVSVFYANEPGKKFDMDYYCNTHMPLVQNRLGTPLKSSAVEAGLGGGEPDAPAPFVAMGHLYFDSVEDFQNSFGPHAEEIMGDIPNYTDIAPTIQVSEVKL